jgi:hypothetical protein
MRLEVELLEDEFRRMKLSNNFKRGITTSLLIGISSAILLAISVNLVNWSGSEKLLCRLFGACKW